MTAPIAAIRPDREFRPRRRALCAVSTRRNRDRLRMVRHIRTANHCARSTARSRHLSPAVRNTQRSGGAGHACDRRSSRRGFFFPLPGSEAARAAPAAGGRGGLSRSVSQVPGTGPRHCQRSIGCRVGWINDFHLAPAALQVAGAANADHTGTDDDNFWHFGRLCRCRWWSGNSTFGLVGAASPECFWRRYIAESGNR